MKKSIFGAAAMALMIGATAMPLTASAQQGSAAVMKMADVNNDGMVSRQEYLDAVAKMYDEKMASMKKMAPGEMAKLMKGDLLTAEGLRIMLISLGGGGTGGGN